MLIALPISIASPTPIIGVIWSIQIHSQSTSWIEISNSMIYILHTDHAYNSQVSIDSLFGKLIGKIRKSTEKRATSFEPNFSINHLSTLQFISIFHWRFSGIITKYTCIFCQWSKNIDWQRYLLLSTGSEDF